MNQQSVFTQTKPLETAVLLLAFNRLDTTKQVFKAIRKARPPKLYFAVDGPRDYCPGEAEKIMTVREFVLKNIDWPCDVKTLFRENNLGCKYAVSSAITWFFGHEDHGIVLEDDCLPTQSFFWFCEELLIRFRDDTRIWQICGFNPLNEFDAADESYYFSKYGPIWGWASWKRAWKHYDVNMSTWPIIKDKKLVRSFTDSYMEKSWRNNLFDRVYNNEVNTWDYQWSFAKLINSALSIVPSRNLIQNIGFGPDATHTTGSGKKMLVFDFDELKHPQFILRNFAFERKFIYEFVRLSYFKLLKNYGSLIFKRIFNHS